MRKAMQETVREIIRNREDTALLLVDIGAYPFRDLLEQYPKRAKNIGIFEAGTVSLAAGLSLAGITPVLYGISPFIVQRALEQIKLDFVYQKRIMAELSANRAVNTSRVTYTVSPEVIGSAIAAYEKNIMEVAGSLNR